MPNAEVCPHCQRPFMPKIKAGHIGRRILQSIEAHPEGISTEDIIRHAYALDPAGGPPHAQKVVHVTIHHLNSQLLDYGCVIRGRKGKGSLYELVKL